MRITMVGDHGCIRVVKEALALKARGHWVELITRVEPFGFNRFDRVSMWHDRDQLIRSVRDSRGDIVHVHNEPDWIVAAAREGTTRPLIYDIHDLESLRMHTTPNADELAAFASADGYVHVSEPCKETAERTHPEHASKPNTVLPCYVNEELYAIDPPRSSPDCLVYEGGLSSTEASPDYGPTVVSLRDLRPMVTTAVQHGLHVGLCQVAALDDHVYANLGATVWGPLPYSVMLRSLRPYGWGFVGACADMPLMQQAMPNKLFEYLSQGVVPVVYLADTAAAFVEEHRIGVRIDGSLDGLACLKEMNHAKVRARVLEARWDWTMEKHISKVEQVYAQALDQKSRIRGLPIAETANDDLGVPV